MTAVQDGELVVVRQDARTIVSAVYSRDDGGWALFEIDFSRATSRASAPYKSYLEATFALRIGAVAWQNK